MNKHWIIAFILMILAVVATSGCTEESAQAKEPTPTNYSVVCCPNPECTLHEPDGWRAYVGRPIEMSVYEDYNSYNNKAYLCGACGHQWEVPT